MEGKLEIQLGKYILYSLAQGQRREATAILIGDVIPKSRMMHREGMLV